MHSQRDSFDITIKNTMANDKETYIHAYQLPIINRDLYDVTFGSGQSLQAMFEPLRLQLIERLRETL
jgi:hypothetical protein